MQINGRCMWCQTGPLDELGFCPRCRRGPITVPKVRARCSSGHSRMAIGQFNTADGSEGLVCAQAECCPDAALLALVRKLQGLNGRVMRAVNDSMRAEFKDLVRLSERGDSVLYTKDSPAYRTAMEAIMSQLYRSQEQVEMAVDISE